MYVFNIFSAFYCNISVNQFEFKLFIKQCFSLKPFLNLLSYIIKCIDKKINQVKWRHSIW